MKDSQSINLFQRPFSGRHFLAAALVCLLALTGTALANLEEGTVDASLIKKVQQKLNQKGFDAGPVDGIMGPKTRSGLKAFQAEEGLPATGRLTEETLDKLGIERGDDAGLLEKAGQGLATAGEAVGKAAKTAASATAKGATKAAKATAEGTEAAAEATATGAKATAKGAKTAAKAAKKGTVTAVEVTEDALTGEDRDDEIRDRIEQRLKEDALVQEDWIDVEVDNAIVTLHFKKQKAGNERAFNRAVSLAKRVPGVKNVFVRFPTQ